MVYNWFTQLYKGKADVFVNGYKKLIKSKKVRIAILKSLDFVPDKVMIELQYFIRLGKFANLKKPKRYSEKIQWYKLYYKDPLMKICVNKEKVHDYVKDCGLEHILNERYGAYSSPDEIDFDTLPNSFVLKDTLGGGGDSVILVEDKSTVNIEELKSTMQKWVDEDCNKKNVGREWIYDGVKHRIIAEKLLKADENGDLPDYKFFCFNGKVYCLYMMENYTKHHSEGRMGFFDKDFKLMDVTRADFKPIVNQPQKPKGYDEMVRYAEILSKEFPHVRVDFYNIDGKIVFGELTFFNASGYTKFNPDSFDYEMGDAFELPQKLL